MQVVRQCWFCGVELTRPPRGRKARQVGCTHLPTEETLEHLVPRSRGGRSRLGETVLACLKCNNTKDALTLEEYRLFAKPPGGKFYREV